MLEWKERQKTELHQLAMMKELSDGEELEIPESWRFFFLFYLVLQF